MPHNPDSHQRRSLRLRGYDYAQPGAYFVTIVTHQRACLFGKIVDSKIASSTYGKITWDVWYGLPNHYANVELDAFVVMPNHVHAIIMLVDNRDVGVDLRSTPTSADKSHMSGKRHPLPEIVRAFKSFCTRQINQLRETPGERVWQRNYWERVIRNERELDALREYIVNNPAAWADDPENPRVHARRRGRSESAPYHGHDGRRRGRSKIDPCHRD